MSSEPQNPGSERTSHDTLQKRLEELLAQANLLANQAPPEGVLLAREARDLARDHGYQAEEAWALIALTRCFSTMAQYAEMLEPARQALQIFEALNDPAGQARSFMMMGIAYMQTADFPEAVLYFEQAIELATAGNDLYTLTMTRGNLSVAEAQLGYWQMAIAIAEDNRKANVENPSVDVQAGLSRCEGFAHLEAGLALIESGNRSEANAHLEVALEHSRNAFALYSRLESVRYKRVALANIATIYEAMGQNELASKAAQDVLRETSEKMSRATVVAQTALASVAHREGRYSEAEALLQAALTVSEEELDIPGMVNICKKLSDVYEALGDVKTALKYSRLAIQYQQRIRDEAIQRRTRMIEEQRKREAAERKTIEYRERLSEKEAQLNHASRLAAAGEMLAVITHEMTQPLAAAIYYSETCLNWIGEETVDPERLRGTLESLCGEVMRAAEVTKRLRRVFSAGSVEVQPVAINKLVQEAIEIARPALRSRGVKLTTRFAAHLPAARADDILIGQVLSNLIRNAIEALDAVNRRPREIRITTDILEDEIAVEVSDNGPGITVLPIDKVFDPFFSTKRGGMGLGLAISRTIAQSFGGHITAGSGDEGGARFTLSLLRHA